MPTKTKKATKAAAETQTIIQINVYRYKDDKLQFLLFKRIDEDNDHFWQPISLKVQNDEPIADTLEKAADQQAGITKLHYLGQELYSYEWYSHGERGRDIVFAAEVTPDTIVFPDLKHYTKFAWMPYKEALLKLTWDGNKKSLRQLMDHLEEREEERKKELERQLEQQEIRQAAIAEPEAEMPEPVVADKEAPKPKAAIKPMPKPPTPLEIPYEHQSNRGLSDELIPNYKNDESDEGSTRVFPL